MNRFMNWLKAYLNDFPTHPATVVSALIVFLWYGVIVNIRMLRGLEMPTGYDNYQWMILAAMGVASAYGVGKRLSDINYKAAGKAPAPTNITMEAPSKMEVKGP